MKEETHRIQVPEYKLSSGESVAVVVVVVVVVVAVVVGNLAEQDGMSVCRQIF